MSPFDWVLHRVGLVRIKRVKKAIHHITRRIKFPETEDAAQRLDTTVENLKLNNIHTDGFHLGWDEAIIHVKESLKL